MVIDKATPSPPPDPSEPDDSTRAALGAPAPADFTRTLADVERFQRGDLRAFDDIWRRYTPALQMLVATRIRPRLPPDLRARVDADDILQVVARKVQEKLGDFEYRGPGSMLGWMSTIAQHTADDMTDYWRAGIRDVRRERDLEPGGGDTRSAADVVADPGRGPRTEANHSELRQAVATAVHQLSERHQSIVIWRFFGGASWDEVAAEVGAPSGAAVRMEFNGKVLPRLARLLPKPG